MIMGPHCCMSFGVVPALYSLLVCIPWFMVILVNKVTSRYRKKIPGNRHNAGRKCINRVSSDVRTKRFLSISGQTPESYVRTRNCDEAVPHIQQYRQQHTYLIIYTRVPWYQVRYEVAKPVLWLNFLSEKGCILPGTLHFYYCKYIATPISCCCKSRPEFLTSSFPHDGKLIWCSKQQRTPDEKQDCRL